MPVIAFASQKGGAGRTTLAGHVAVLAERCGVGPVTLVDADPQGSLADWWNERSSERRPSPKPPSSDWARISIGSKT